MKKHALFIGIDHYEDAAITPLRCAARDARELAALFKHQLKFETTVLTHDDLNAGRSINSELRRIKKALEPGDVFVLFFAGHGKTANVPEGADQLFLLPMVDASLLDRAYVVGEGVQSYRSLCAQTDTWTGVHRAFIFDACRLPIKRFEAESRDSSNLARFEGEVVYRGLALGPSRVAVAAASLVTLNSCHDQQRAEELPSYQSGHGLFTAALLETLKDYEARQQSVVLDDELTQALATRMHQLARTHAQRDTPQRPLRIGAPVRLHEAVGQDVVGLVANFERQMAAGQLNSPVGDNCTATLQRLGGYGQNHAQIHTQIHTLNARLQQALDARELVAQRQRDQKKFDVACQLDTAIAYGNYLATCELGEHTAQAQAAMLAKKQQEQVKPTDGVAPVVQIAPPEPSPKPQPKPDMVPPSLLKPPVGPRPDWVIGGAVGLILVAALGGGYFLGKNETVRPIDLVSFSMEASAPAASVPAPEKYPVGSSFQDKLAGGGLGPWMVVVPAGSFKMGSDVAATEKNGPQVTIAKPFAVGKFEVTVAEYKACVAAGKCRGPEWNEAGSQYHYQTGKDAHYKKLGDALFGARYPIVGVSWHDAKAYFAWLNGSVTDGQGKYRLLSEAEWEYAACAKTSTSRSKWGYGDDEAALGQYAWYYINSGAKTHEVGGKTANAFGLHDMHGNVWEWVEDVWHDDYTGAPQDGSAWLTVGNSEDRVLRGGSWGNFPSNLRSAYRGHFAPVNRDIHLGLRVARTLP